MANGLEIVRCSHCDKETYEGLQKCPHCSNELVAAKPRQAEVQQDFRQPRFEHTEFRRLLKERAVSVQLNMERIKSRDFYPLFPTYYVVGLIIFAIAIVITVGAAIVAIFILDTSGPEPAEDWMVNVIAGSAMALIFGAIHVRNWVRGRLVIRRMIRDKKFYRDCIGNGFARVVERPVESRNNIWDVFE